MTHLLVRVEVADYDAWLRTHLKHAQDRRAYGMTDGPIYRDITNPNAVLVHTIAEDLDRAGQWLPPLPSTGRPENPPRCTATSTSRNDRSRATRQIHPRPP